MRLINCPNCGGSFSVDTTKRVVCPYCDTDLTDAFNRSKINDRLYLDRVKDIRITDSEGNEICHLDAINASVRYRDIGGNWKVSEPLQNVFEAVRGGKGNKVLTKW